MVTLLTNIFITLLLFSGLSLAQSLTEAQQRTNVKEQAEKMGKALLAKDLKTFISYTYPRVVESMGGKEKMEEFMKKQMADGGPDFQSITIGEPSRFILSKHNIQCVVSQTFVMKSGEGTISATSSLIAFSGDGGNNWTFIDVSTHDLKTLRKLIPEISSKLVIPPMSKPVFTKDTKL